MDVEVFDEHDANGEHEMQSEGVHAMTLVDVRRELTNANDTDKASASALKVVENALARQVMTKKLSLQQLSVTNNGLGLFERAMEELKLAREAAKEGVEALELVMQTVRRAASERDEDDGFCMEHSERSTSTAEKAAKMAFMVGELAAERDRALEAKFPSREGSLSSEKAAGVTEANACFPSTQTREGARTGKQRSSLYGLTVPTKGGIARPTADTNARGSLSANNDADWAQKASAPPPSIPITAVTAAKPRELAEVAERAEAGGSTPINLTRVLDSLVVTPFSAEPVSGGKQPRRPDEMADVLTRVATIVRKMANPDSSSGGGGDGEADARLHDVLELVAQLDAARRSAEDVAAAAHVDVAAMRAEVAVAWEALDTPRATPTQSSVERFAEELEALLHEKDAVTAVAAQEVENKRRAIVASTEAQRQLVLQTSARARAESALRSAHEQVEGLKRHARELADVNQTSRQQVAAERGLVQRLKNETKLACDREEKERRRADSMHAEAHKLRSGMTARTREAFRNAEAARVAREEAERERRANQLLRVREQQLESKVCELANAVAHQAHVVSKSRESQEAATVHEKSYAVSGLAVRELEVLVQELAHEEIRSRRHAAEAEAASKVAKEATAEALSEIAALRAEVSTMEGRMTKAKEGGAQVS
jgi:hypothetical protein